MASVPAPMNYIMRNVINHVNSNITLNTLLIEDDRDLAATIVDYLEIDSIKCDHAYSGNIGFNLICENDYDVIMLDIMLPNINGLELCEQIRNQGIDTPILMLTARSTLQDKIDGFRVGTDDYLVKPFALEELVLRLHALAKRRSGQMKVLRVLDLEMNLTNKTSSRAGQKLNLTQSEWMILEILMRASPTVVSRRTIERALWPDLSPKSNSLKVHIFNLRQQIDKPFPIPILTTIPNVGFVLKTKGSDEE